jgi:calcium-dependent protein kinase
VHLVTEWLSGGDLYDAVPCWPAPVRVARPVFRCILLGLAYMHASGVMHRDVKPGNVALVAPGAWNTAKLIDFGLARRMRVTSRDAQRARERHACALSACGTREYVAPEVIRGGVLYRESADVWSAGVVLFELLTGGVPFGGETDAEVFRRAASLEVAYPTRVPHAARDLIGAMLQKDPARRPSAGRALEHAWAQGRADEEPGPRRRAPPRRFSSPSV